MSKVIQKAANDHACVLDYYDATHILNAPFTVILRKSVKQMPPNSVGSKPHVFIPDPEGLIKAVAQARVLHPQKLTGPDIRFLRGALERKSKEFAKLINVTPEHLSRLESGGKVMSPQSEMLVRVFTFAYTIPFTPKKEAGGEEIAQLVSDFFSDFSIVPVRLAEDRLELSFRRISSKPNAGDEECGCDDGLWDQPPPEPSEPIAA